MANKIVLPNSRNGVVRDLGYQGMLVEIQDEIITHSDIVLGLDLPLIGMQA